MLKLSAGLRYALKNLDSYRSEANTPIVTRIVLVIPFVNRHNAGLKLTCGCDNHSLQSSDCFISPIT